MTERWKYRFQNYQKAYMRLARGVEREELDDLAQAGLIQTFELTFELAWKCLKAKLELDGYIVKTPRDIFKQAFQVGYISDGHIWMDALEKRNMMTHTYNEKVAEEVVHLIQEKYFPAARELYLFFKDQK